MTIKAILFDKDGTLIDFASTFFDACSNIIFHLADNNGAKAQKLADAFKFDLVTKSCSAASEIVGGTSFTIAEIWQPLLQRPSVELLSQELDEYFDEFTKTSVSPFDFTGPTLRTLSSVGIKLGVATNDSERNARSHLNHIGIEQMFDFIAGYDSGHGSKPEPGMVREFSRRADVNVGEVAMVGDSLNDLLAGSNAGARTIAVTSGVATAGELRAHADYVIEDISHLPKLLSQLK